MRKGLIGKLLGPASIGLGAVGAVAGAVQANQTRQRNKGLISQAYESGRGRLETAQADQRQSQSEGLIARGILSGGGAPVGGEAHDLGGQAQVDLGHEQGLARDEMAQEYRNALTENKRAGTQGIIGSLIGGVQTGMDAYGALSSIKSLRSGGASGAPALATTSDRPFTGAFGIDPVDPLGYGAWGTNDRFNVFGGY